MGIISFKFIYKDVQNKMQNNIFWEYLCVETFVLHSNILHTVFYISKKPENNSNIQCQTQEMGGGGEQVSHHEHGCIDLKKKLKPK